MKEELIEVKMTVKQWNAVQMALFQKMTACEDLIKHPELQLMRSVNEEIYDETLEVFNIIGNAMGGVE